jgi:hypothetical protein
MTLTQYLPSGKRREKFGVAPVTSRYFPVADDRAAVNWHHREAMKTDRKPTSELKRVREWAQEKIQGGSEPPWAWYQYMKLVETVDAILDGIAGTTTGNLPQSEEHQGKRLRLVESTCQQDAALHRPGKLKIRMPM